MQLRPNAFYELTHGCQLTFADIKCVYYVDSLPEDEGAEEEEPAEATQAYSVDDDAATKEDAGIYCSLINRDHPTIIAYYTSGVKCSGIL